MRANSSSPVSVIESFKAAEAARAKSAISETLPHRFAVAYIAVSVAIMAYSPLFQVIPILLFFAVWLPLPFFKGIQVLRVNAGVLLVLAVPLLSMVSSLWSDYPFTTLYQSVEFFIMMLCLVIMQRVVTFEAFLQGLVIGLTLVLLLALLNGRFIGDEFGGARALVGHFSSKNTVGYLAELGILTSCIQFFSQPGRLKKMLLGVVPMILCATCLFLSKSGTALLSLIIALSVVGWVMLLMHVSKAVRAVYIGASLLLLCFMLIVGFSHVGQDFVLSALGKDASLTGRTYLWQEGMKVAMQSPWLGHGYAGFWVKGQPLAERYWFEFFINARMGFHFHSGFIQTMVDLGIVGLTLLLLLLLATAAGLFRLFLRQQHTAETYLLLGFLVMFIVRLVAEVDFLGPFGMGVMIFYAVPLRLASRSSVRVPQGVLAVSGMAPKDGG